ncbi:MAG: hypothetical protein M3O46_21410 [Myxococcota bacterium]|nr:hypothetical protein [Myxococcota bacterium]
MKLIRKTFAAGLIAAVTVVACSSHHGSDGTGTDNSIPGNVGTTAGGGGKDSTGSVGGHLTIAPGIKVFALGWTISNGTNSYTGTVNFGDAEGAEFTAGGIQQGSGYTATLTGSDTNGDPCTGTSMPFSVAAGALTAVVMQVTCTAPTDSSFPADVTTGSVSIDAGVNFVQTGAAACPGISSFSISPAALPPGGNSQVGVSTVGPSPVITWSVSPASAGTFSDIHGANPTFQCLNPNQQSTITVQVGLPDSGICNGQTFTSMSALFNCLSGAASCAPGQTNCAAADAGALNCVTLSSDPANCGTCGHACTAGQSCSAGTCTSAPPTACTTAPCAASGANSAQCVGSPGGVCTPTQAIIMNYDIAHNGQGAGAAVAIGCYRCMVDNACLDADGTTNTLGTAVTNAECGDPDPASPNPPFASRNVSATNVPHCIDALSCLLTGNAGAVPHCTTTPPSPASVSNCFCGSNRGSACIASPSAPVGTCASKEFTDLGTTDPTTALSHYTDTTFSPGGVGNAILNCAQVAGSAGACAGLPCFK